MRIWRSTMAMAKKGVTAADIVDAVDRLVKKHGEELTQRQFVEETGFSEQCIYRKFGGWLALKRELGYSDKRPSNTKRRVHYRQDIAERLRELVEQIGPNITVTTFWKLTGISPTSIATHCGSWGQLRASVGLPLPKRGGIKVPDDVLYAELHRVATWLKRFPTQSEFERMSPISAQTVRRRLGPWDFAESKTRQFLASLAMEIPDGDRRAERLKELADRVVGSG